MGALYGLAGVAGGVGANLLADQFLRWKQQARPPTPADVESWLQQELAQRPDLRAVLDEVLAKLEVVPELAVRLSEADKQWLREALRRELTALGNLPRFEAALSGIGAIAQNHSIAIGRARDVTIQQGRVEPDTHPLREAYLNRLLEQCSSLSLTGIDPKAASSHLEARLELSAVYTALLTREVELANRPATLLTETRPNSALEQLDRQPRLVLLGDPGSGKTTFVDFVAMCLAGELLGHPLANLKLLSAPLPDDEGQHQEQAQPWRHGALLPVKVVLRDFAARGLPAVGEAASAEHLWGFIVAELKQATLGAWAQPLSRELLERGGLLLLDGLDEVPEADRCRAQIKEAITDFGRVFRRCRMVVTSRTYAYQQQEWRLPAFAEALLAPFSRGQIIRFVEGWYRHIAALRGLNLDDAQGRAELLKRAIFSSDHLSGLAERPLLLTLMASLHAWRGGSLPEKREELYADTVDLLLDWWESPKVVRGVQGQLEVRQRSLAEWLKVDRAKMRQQLNQLAYEAHAGQAELTGTADVSEAALVTGLLHLSQNPEVNPLRLIEYLRDRAGLLLPRGVGVYTFPHRTFQEYLAACYLTDSDFPERVADLARREPNRWREVALLAGAKAARGTSAAIWQLADALCYRPAQREGEPEDRWGALLAGQSLVETANLQQVSERNQPRLANVRQWLVNIVRGETMPAVERVAAGVSLAYLGDPRPGVGLRPDGLPDILWCEVPAGPFLYGDEQERVELAAFKISQFAVTNAQFNAFVNDGGYTERQRHCWTDAGWQWRQQNNIAGPAKLPAPYNLPNHPAVGVSWYEAVAFCAWLSEKFKKSEALAPNGEMSLPTEQQWEKAARGSDGRIYPWGNEADPNKANYDDSQIGYPGAVGCFPQGRSPYGCLDMSGNVWEWCRTKYDTPDDHNLEGKALRVLWGGAFFNSDRYARCARRNWTSPDGRHRNIGFRLGCVAPILTSEL